MGPSTTAKPGGQANSAGGASMTAKSRSETFLSSAWSAAVGAAAAAGRTATPARATASAKRTGSRFMGVLANRKGRARPGQRTEARGTGGGPERPPPAVRETSFTVDELLQVLRQFQGRRAGKPAAGRL